MSRGRGDRVRRAAITSEPLSVDAVLAAVTDRRAGGICIFLGVVRETDDGRGVEELAYSEHPTATDRLREVADLVTARHPVTAVAVTHRVGTLEVGELAVVVAVSAPHRAEAFEACRDLIDTLKRDVPLWKHQRFSDGDAVWVGA